MDSSAAIKAALAWGGYFVAAIAVIIILTCTTLLHNTRTAPKQPKGWGTLDYDGSLPTRAPMSDAVAALPLNKVSVATANFGGIFTEDTTGTNPWIGTVSTEAVTLQVAGGARAIVFDVWPDPADPKTPVVCAMADSTQWWVQNFWRNYGGLGQGTGRYSNWQLLTRNTVPLADMLSAAFHAAFAYPNSPQNNDPFFLFLKFHGAYTADHFNGIGSFISTNDDIATHTMDAQWINANNQRNAGQTPMKEFAAKTFITVIPDIQPGYRILPGVMTYDTFVTAFLQTGLAQYTNAIERSPNSIVFDPNNLAAAQSASQPSPELGGGPIAPIETGLCLIQPSVGGQTTDNAKLFDGSSYSGALGTGAEFVAVNLFSANKADPAMSVFVQPSYFGKSSFRATASS
jgi:hypothetical protein